MAVLACLLCGVAAAAAQPAPPCADPVPVYRDGRRGPPVCAEAAGDLTVVDLSEDFAPKVLGDAGGGARYRHTYLELAAERGPERDLELLGVFPTPEVVGRRLLDEQRHLCHDEIDGAPLLLGPPAIAPDAATPRALRDAPGRREAIRAVQAHLACDGLLAAGDSDGKFGRPTAAGLARWRARQMIARTGAIVDEDRDLFLAGSRELDFRSLLRSLRERVVEAAGLLEDGSAVGRWGTVLGRDLEGAGFRDADGHPPLGNGAADLVSPATEAAALALGWTSPALAAAFFRARGDEGAGPLRVALPLPAAPAYHGPDMALRVEIDRGDVWYEYPFTPAGKRRSLPIEKSASITLFAVRPEGDLALARWPTTIGGWQREKRGAGEVLRYKDSRPGLHVWADVVGAPVWFPPPSTPDRELVRRSAGRWVVRWDTLGPGPRSAYGLMLITHRRPETLADTGVRTHGTVSFRSVPGPASHGCHRLFNHLALRLGAFLLSHRPSVLDGDVDEEYRRQVRWGGRHQIRLTTRGYRHHLDPPIPVRVLEGRVRGLRKQPHTRAFPVP